MNYNTRHLLANCFAQLRIACAGLATQTIVVDNSSADGSLDFLRQHCPDWTVLANNENMGFGRANNVALPWVQGRYLLLLNTDAFVASDTLARTLAYMDNHPQIGILGVRLVGRDGAPQPSARSFPTPWALFLQRTGLQRFFPGTPVLDDPAGPEGGVRSCDWVPGCYYLVRRQVIEQVGLFDPRFFLYYEEVDHCRAAKAAGWEVACYPHTAVVHIGGESAQTIGALTPGGRQIEALQMESELLYFRKHHGQGGLLADVALTVAGDLVLAAKGILKRRDPLCLDAYWRHARLACGLLRRTDWGRRPTH